MTGISVIIPTYNRASFLARALHSVRRQTLACNEILVVDDGSTDETEQIVIGFSKECSIPVRYICQDNKGPASARNVGIERARFPFLAFLDSDDHWQKKKLQLQFDALTAHPEILISHTQERWYRRGIHLNQKKIHQPGNGDIFKHCLQICAVGMSTVMVKKEFFDEIGVFDEKFRCCEDYDLWLRGSCRYPFLLVETPLTIKEGGRNDQVSYEFRVGMDKLRIWSIANLLRRGTLSRKHTLYAIEELQRKCHVYGKGCIKHGRNSEGEVYISVADWAESVISNDCILPVEVPKHLITSLTLK